MGQCKIEDKFYGKAEKWHFKFYGKAEKMGFKFYGKAEKWHFKFYGIKYFDYLCA